MAGGGGGGGTIFFIVFSAVSRGGLWPKSGQAIARMPDRRLRPCVGVEMRYSAVHPQVHTRTRATHVRLASDSRATRERLTCDSRETRNYCTRVDTNLGIPIREGRATPN